MKTHLLHMSTLIVILMVLGMMTGCYTQLGTVRDESPSPPDYNDQEYTDQQSWDDSASTDTYQEYGWDDHGSWRHRIYFDYYYPSSYFGFGYYSPWYWRPYYYSPFAYYDPFWNGWCYNGSYDGLWYPHYGYRGGGAASNYTAYRTRSQGVTRTLGASPGAERTRITRDAGDTQLPIGMSRGGQQTSVRDRERAARPSRAGVSAPRRDPGRDAAKMTRDDPAKSSKGYRSTRDGVRPGQSRTPALDTRSTGRSERTSEGRSYSPPPAPPRSSSPPPSNTGTTRRDGASRDKKR